MTLSGKLALTAGVLFGAGVVSVLVQVGIKSHTEGNILSFSNAPAGATGVTLMIGAAALLLAAGLVYIWRDRD